MLKPPMNKLSIVKASKKQNSLYNDTHKKKQDFKEILWVYKCECVLCMCQWFSECTH